MNPTATDVGDAMVDPDGKLHMARHDRWSWWMLNGSAVVLLILMILVCAWGIDDDPSPWWVPVGAIALWALSYLPIAIRPKRARDTAWLITVSVTLLIAVAVAYHKEQYGAGVLFMAVYPHVWLLTDNTRKGIILTLLVTLSAFAGLWTAVSFRALSFGESLVFVMSAAISLLLGMWINWMASATEQRWELATQLSAANAELQQLHHDQGVLNERSRLAGEIHDTLAQGFLSITALSQLARATADDPDQTRDTLQLIEDTARQNLAESRALVAAWTPPDLDAGLAAAVQRTVRRVTSNSDLHIDVHLTIDDADVDNERGTILLRALQEGLTNVVRHANATHARVEVNSDDESVRLHVLDNGVGIAANAPVGYGLELMQRRASDLGGSMHVRAVNTGGTELTVHVPLPPTAQRVDPADDVVLGANAPTGGGSS